VSKHQQRNQRPAPLPPDPAAPAGKVDFGPAPERVIRFADPDHTMVPAVFTERELDELRKICRDADSELGVRFLAAGLARALPIRPVDGVR
jgi:hypothetical protein